MATTTITALSSIGTIDPANDVLPIVDVSLNTTTKVTPNALFGITGNVVGTTDTQSVSNKTLDNTNVLTIKDTNLTIQDDGDVTKQAKFQASAISTGTTRTYTLPDITDTLTANTATQTLTNKSLTAPVITGGTINNAAINVDSINGFSTSTIVSVGGVQMNNGIVATAGAVNTNSIAAGAVVPNSLFASTGTGWAWSSWTPTWTNLTVGNGTLSYAKYIQIGKTVFFRIRLVFGTTTSISGVPSFTMPVSANSDGNIISTMVDGTVWLVDSAVNNWRGFMRTDLANTISLYVDNSASTYTSLSNGVNTTVPYTWDSNGVIQANGQYEAA